MRNGEGNWLSGARPLGPKAAALAARLGEGCRAPAATAVGYSLGNQVAVERVYFGAEEPLPALALATMLAVAAPQGSMQLSVYQLTAATELLEELEQEAETERPAARAWNYLLAGTPEGGATAVFVDELVPDAAVDAASRVVLAHLFRGRVENADGTTTLWRPVGPAELEQLQASDMRAWPQRLPDQPIFYPVLNQAYARQIATEWNVPASGSGFVTRFRVTTSFARRYPTRQAGGLHHLELWIPAEEVDGVNRNLHGLIELVE